MRVVIIGALFGGLTKAYELRKHFGRRSCEITLLSKDRRFVFIPSLPWVTIGSRTVGQISFDLEKPLARKSICFVLANSNGGRSLNSGAPRVIGETRRPPGLERRQRMAARPAVVRDGRSMISLDEARSRLTCAVRPLAPVSVELAEALGRCLAEPVRSDVDLPSADVSAMDGYAVRHADLAVGRPLTVAAEIAAGTVGGPLAPGFAARIFTGAPLPSGADTVVQQELAKREGAGQVILDPCVAGTHVRRRGEVIAAGNEMFDAGAWVTPQMVSLLASCGASTVEVVPAPAIAAVITGAEVVDASGRPGPGRIRDTNGPLLTALAAASDLAISSRARAADTKEALHAALSEALAASDLVITTGGVSVGDYDLVPEVVTELGGELLFHRVRMKPGKPLLAARIGSKLLLGLPGNPLAVLAGWRLFAWPAAATMAGDERAFQETPVEARLTLEASVPRTRTELRPAVLRGGLDGLSVELVSWRGSHDVLAGAQADALARFEPGGCYTGGSQVPCYPLASADPRPGRCWSSSK